MTERIVAFDVETPNCRNHRMSAIGVCIVEEGKLVQEFATLVNPQTRFDPFNITLTGIKPEDVADAPTFPELWQRLRPWMDSGILIAHNAPFDMSVLAKCLHDYHIAWKPSAQYACTCKMARACFPQLENHRLNTVSNYLGIVLDHHQASSDAHACAEIFCACRRCGMSLLPFLRSYDFSAMRTVRC